jgi:hypothetical protein
MNKNEKWSIAMIVGLDAGNPRRLIMMNEDSIEQAAFNVKTLYDSEK